MPAYNFKRRFAKKVESGQKTQTIRKIRKYPTRVGQKIYLWTGLRTKRARRLGIGMIEAVIPFELINENKFKAENTFFYPEYFSNGKRLAEKDGFEDWDSFVRFFEVHYGLPFEGVIIRWRLLDADSTTNNST